MLLILHKLVQWPNYIFRWWIITLLKLSASGGRANLQYCGITERNPADKSPWRLVTLHPAQISPSDKFPISPPRCNLSHQYLPSAALPNPPVWSSRGRMRLSRKTDEAYTSSSPDTTDGRRCEAFSRQPSTICLHAPCRIATSGYEW